MTTSAPPSLGAAPTFPGLAGTATLISKPIPAPMGTQGWGAGGSSLYLRGGHHALALRKARKLGCLGGEFGEGGPVWELQGRCLLPPSLTAHPWVCPQWTPAQGSDRHCSRAAMR